MTLAATNTSDLLLSREGCIQLATAATENYRECMLLVVEAWVKNGYGSVNDLADAIDKSHSQIRKYATELRKQGRLPQSNKARFGESNPSLRSKAVATVENKEVIEVEVLEPKEQTMTDQEAAAFNGLVDLCAEQEQEISRLTAMQSNTTENNVRRHQPDSPDAGDLGPEPVWGNTDAEHWQHIQECDEPDSYKRAQEHLTHFKRLLQEGSRRGWSEQAFAALRDDLEQYARTCAACSDNSRERNLDRVAKERTSLPSSVQRGEG